METQSPPKSPKSRGSSLMEVVVAVGVLAIAVPLIFGSIAESGNAGQSSSAETRAPWMVRAGVEEIQASRVGKARFFTNTAAEQTLPPTGEIWALAFTETGMVIGKLSQTEYDDGLRKLGDSDVRYIANIQSSNKPSAPLGNTAMPVRVTIEFPAGAPAENRRSIDFHTLVP